MALEFMFGLLLAFAARWCSANGESLALQANFQSGVQPEVIHWSRYCNHFIKNVNLNHGPCTSEDLDENGHCNITQTCADNSHCYTSWRNDSGIIEIVASGCWLDCEVLTDDCRAFNDSAVGGVFFCCCTGDFCHLNFNLDPAIDNGDDEPGPVDESYHEWLIIVYILGPLFAVAVLGILGYYLWRRRSKALEDMDGVSVDTPATGATRCTTVSFPASMELPSPQLLEVKARGRFGKVWRAQLHDKLVAVKTFDLREKQSWQNEQDIFCTPLMSTHPNILKFLTASNRGEGLNSELLLITEFYDRGSLADYLTVHTVTLIDALRIMRTMASGMSFLHEDVQTANNDYKPAIAHRDFKSKNVLLDQDLNAVIADFGLAVKFTPGERPGQSHGQVGTLRYMAPEVLEGAINFQKDAFLRIDMYAFGLVSWEILSRCSNTSAECGKFLLPFEKELGTHPTFEKMQDHVVEKKLRPEIKDEWRRDELVAMICETMEECWDHDAEARLSAGCVELRVSGLQRQKAQTQTPLIVNMPSSPAQSNVEAMNQLNLQMNILNDGKNLNQHKNGQLTQTSNFTEGSQDQVNQTKMQVDSYVAFPDEDHDSGTFANEDTLSHDGVMEQLIGSDDNMLQVRVIHGDGDSATSLLTSEELETDV